MIDVIGNVRYICIANFNTLYVVRLQIADSIGLDIGPSEFERIIVVTSKTAHQYI